MCSFRKIPFIAALLLVVTYVATAPARAGDDGKKAVPVLDPVGEKPLPKTFEVVPGKDSPWSFTIEPYAWLPGLSGNIGLGGLGPVHVDYGAGKVLSDFQWGAFLKGEVRYGKWGLLADGMFVDLETQADTPGILYNNTTITIQQGLAQLAVAYRVWEDHRGFVDIYAGARYNYYGIGLSADLNTSTISQLSTDITERVSSAIDSRVQSALGGVLNTLATAVATQVSQSLTERATRSVVGSVGYLPPAKQRELSIVLTQVRNEIGGLIQARAEAAVAAANNALTQELTNAVTSAEKKLAKALAKKLEDVLPVEEEGDRWWVDPIIGVRAQVNITRWLYLATQCDVGGFGAGSQIAWNLNGAVGVNFTRYLFGEVGYRYYYLDYNQSGVLYQVAESGLFVGGGVRF